MSQNNLQLNINPYDPIKFEKKFQKTALYKQLQNEYDLVYFSHVWYKIYSLITPRQLFGESFFSAIPFYYLEYLTAQNPKEIYDLGCGWNIFKKYISNIVGIGAEDNEKYFYGDIYDYIDDNFVNGHQNYFESVFSINALHFIPLSDIRKRVVDFISMIKPGGYGFLALNVKRMIERDSKFENYSVPDLEKYIRAELYDVPAEYKVFEVNLEILDEWMDGNIRLICHKTI